MELATPVGPKVVYILVTEDGSGTESTSLNGIRYTRDAIKDLLQILGCKPRHSYKATRSFFQRLEELAVDPDSQPNLKSVEIHRRNEVQVFASMRRLEFYEHLCSCVSEYKYKYSPYSEDLKVACSLRERRCVIAILLCGTSGSGKSTLASILANRLGITTVLSTDSIRHMMRSFVKREEDPLVWASTYEAGELIDPGAQSSTGECLTHHERTIKGYKAQCEAVVEHLGRLLPRFEASGQSLVVEGVHLSINFVVKLMQRHPSLLPFLIHIGDERRHVERMAVRAKAMALDPNKNKYVRHMRAIRWIQEYLISKAEKHFIPIVENTNIDRSVGLIHLAVLGVMRRMMRGENGSGDAAGSTARMLHSEYIQVCDSLSGSSRSVMDAVRAASAARQGTEASTSYSPIAPPLPSRLPSPSPPRTWPSPIPRHQNQGTGSYSAASPLYANHGSFEAPSLLAAHTSAHYDLSSSPPRNVHPFIPNSIDQISMQIPDMPPRSGAASYRGDVSPATRSGSEQLSSSFQAARSVLSPTVVHASAEPVASTSGGNSQSPIRDRPYQVPLKGVRPSPKVVDDVIRAHLPLKGQLRPSSAGQGSGGTGGPVSSDTEIETRASNGSDPETPCAHVGYGSMYESGTHDDDGDDGEEEWEGDEPEGAGSRGPASLMRHLRTAMARRAQRQRRLSGIHHDSSSSLPGVMELL